MIQPELGKRLEEIRSTAKNGKKMSRGDFGQLLGISPTQLRNIEQGRKLKDDELQAILAKYPELGAVAFYDDSQTSEYDQPLQTLTEDEVSESDDFGGWGQPVEEHYVTSKHYGDLVAFDEELEDPEAAEVVDTSTILGVVHPEEREWQPGDSPVLPPVPESSYPPDATELPPAYPDEAPSGALSQGLDAHFISNSEVQTFKRCRRKWWLGWYLRLKPKAESLMDARATGTRVHTALQAMYPPHGTHPADPREALERAITEDWTKLTKMAAEEGYEDVPPEMAKQFNDACALERIMVEGYVQWVAEEGVDRELQIIAPETYLEAELPVPSAKKPVILLGKIDARAVRESDGARVFVDHKTVGDLTKPVKTLHLDEQMLTYHLLEYLNAVDGGHCDGALYNMLRKVKRTARANPPFYMRVAVRHNRYELESFKKRLIGTVATMLQVRAHLDTGTDHHVVAYPTPKGDCSWDCDFFSICGMFDDGSRVEAAIEGNYVQGDPLDRYRQAQRGEDRSTE